MLEDKKNLKDSNSSLPNLTINKVEEQGGGVSYTKSNKLVTALFLVTDIMDKSEPLRRKLRTLGIEILSDLPTGQVGIHADPTKSLSKISEVLSFLEVAQSVNLISPMNAKILINEFLKLMDAVKEYKKVKSVWIEEFLGEDYNAEHIDDKQKYSELVTRRHVDSRTPTRLGVQKAGSLMDALRGVTSYHASDRKNSSSAANFDVLKKHRRADIVSVLNSSEAGLTITDIKNKSKGHENKFSALASCGEKTLQRELVAMVRDGVLKREGEKRWSRYSIVR